MKILAGLTFSLLVAPMAIAADLDSKIQSSRATTKSFMGQLKGELQSAMKSGGPVNAIQVCNTRAPEITAQVSAKKGWKVGRTSIKLRNTSNMPDAWEQKVLQQFEKRKAAGEDPMKIEFSEVVSNKSGQSFRYMKAIPTGGVCLACHGQAIQPEVTAKLDELYPNDKARGFNLGDIRGAFTITQPM